MRHTGAVVSGNLVTALFQFAAIALAARALGTERFGLFALLQSTVMLADGAINVQATQAVIKFGATEVELGRRVQFIGLVKLGLWVDFVTSCCGVLLAIACIWVAGFQLGWSREVVGLGMLFSLRILFHLTGTARAVLRLFDCFALQASQQMMAGAARLLGAFVAWWGNTGLVGFVIAWLLGDILESLLLLAAGWRVLHERGYRFTRASTVAAPEGFWGFLCATNLTESVASLRYLDTLIVGAVLGSSAAGLLQVGKQYVSVLRQFTAPLIQVVFPIFARLVAREEHRELRRMTRLSTLSAGFAAMAIWLGFVLLGRTVIGLTHGPAFLAAYPVAVWYVLGGGVTLTAFPLVPAVLALGRSWKNLGIQTVSYAFFLPLSYVLTKAFGLPGAGAAFVCHQIFRAGCMTILGYFAGSQPTRRESPPLACEGETNRK